jgi:hypothetical protein
MDILSPWTFWYKDILARGHYNTGTFRHKNISAHGHFDTGKLQHHAKQYVCFGKDILVSVPKRPFCRNIHVLKFACTEVSPCQKIQLPKCPCAEKFMCRIVSLPKCLFPKSAQANLVCTMSLIHDV